MALTHRPLPLPHGVRIHRRVVAVPEWYHVSGDASRDVPRRGGGCAAVARRRKRRGAPLPVRRLPPPAARRAFPAAFPRSRPRPRRRGAHSGARPARTRTARPRGGTAPSAARRPRPRRARGGRPDLDARSSEAASRSSVVKVRASRCPPCGWARPAEAASPADATARGDADSKHGAADREPIARPARRRAPVCRRCARPETLAPKLPRHRASPTKPEGRSGCDGFELADDVEYYAARLEALAPLTSAERGDFDAPYAAYPEAFGERDARDAFALAATRSRYETARVHARWRRRACSPAWVCARR